MESKNKKLLDEFVKYAKKNPELRFWQCLSGWTRKVIYIQKYSRKVDDMIVEDSYFWKNKLN